MAQWRTSLRNPNCTHWLSKTVGHDAALAICRALAGGVGAELLVPMGPNAGQVERWRRIDRILKDGWSAAAIARATGSHLRTVKRHRNGHVKTRDMCLTQSDLFSEQTS